jgi:hypothetical protein
MAPIHIQKIARSAFYRIPGFSPARNTGHIRWSMSLDCTEAQDMTFILLTWLVITTVVAAGDHVVLQCVGELQVEEQRLQDDLQKPLSHWLTQLESHSADERERAVVVLKEAAGLVQDLHAFTAKKDSDSPLLFYRELSDRRQTFFADVSRARIAKRYAAQIRESLDQLIEMIEPLMQQQDVGFNARTTASILAQCIAVSFPDGTGIVRARRKLPTSLAADKLLEHFLGCTACTIPAGRSLHVVLLPELRRLSPETKLFLAREWEEAHEVHSADESGMANLRRFSLGLYATGILSGLVDRFQEEMPLFLETLKPEHPQLIRCASLACLATMQWEAEPALPAIHKLLDDDSPTIRHLAAMTIVNVQMEPGKSNELAIKAKMSDKQRAEFNRFAIEAAEEFLDDSLLDLVTPGHKHFSEELMSYFESGPEPSRRSMLRIIRVAGRNAWSLEPQVRMCLTSNDPLTREFAKKALKAILEEQR